MRKNMLIIEPDPCERGKLQDLFSNDYLLTFVHSCREAAKIPADDAFPVVLFDLGPAETLSLRELHLFKSDHPYCQSIIALTSRNDIALERALASVGVFYHLLAPYSESDLQTLVGAAFRTAEKESPFISLREGDHDE
jgi:DNA-binding NtrC family response regulator